MPSNAQMPSVSNTSRHASKSTPGTGILPVSAPRSEAPDDDVSAMGDDSGILVDVGIENGQP